MNVRIQCHALVSGMGDCWLLLSCEFAFFGERGGLTWNLLKRT